MWSIGRLENRPPTHFCKRVAVFHDYASSCSGEYRDYLVEPFKMDVNSVNVAALDQVEILEGDALWDYVQERCRMGQEREMPAV